LLNEVEVFILPHHGSNRSIHDEVIKRLKGSMMLACAATGRDTHPHLLLLGRLHMYDQCVWQVSEDAESGYILNVTLTN
jgi:beta-lactamase superfamily II metal-dependent hydrolase